MGYPFDIEFKEKHVEFRLPNKPEYLCLIDIEDFIEHVAGTKCWYIHRSTKSKADLPYIRARGGEMHLHRVVLGAGEVCMKSSVVDHLNRNGLDNRKHNIKIGTAYDNSINKELVERSSGFAYRKFHSFLNKGTWQCYKGKKYICGSRSIDILKQKIDTYIESQEGSK